MKNTIILPLILFHAWSVHADYGDYSTYPTNFDKLKNRFKTERPTIGILTMANEDKKLFTNVNADTDNTTYVAASYVKLIEAGGARAVPLLADMPDEDLMKVIRSINGVILSGGDGDLANSHYEKVARMVYQYSIKKLDEEGERWPVLGICRGSQILPVITARRDFLIHTFSKNYSIPLDFYKENYKKSKLFKNAPSGIIKILKEKPITINAHLFSLPTKAMLENRILADFYRLISTNVDKQGVEFVSTYEGTSNLCISIFFIFLLSSDYCAPDVDILHYSAVFINENCSNS